MPLPELGLIAATRGMMGAGAMLLASVKMDRKRRKMIGWPLLAIGALSTIPFVIDIVRRVKAEGELGH